MHRAAGLDQQLGIAFAGPGNIIDAIKARNWVKAVRIDDPALIIVEKNVEWWSFDV